MTTTLASTPLRAAPPAPIARQRFSTLLRVELRKATDTRSGRGVLAGAIALAMGLLIYKLCRLGSHPADFANFNEPVLLATGYILPIVGLLAMTSEWTQRTALTTFTSSPRRLSVMGAKFAAALVLSIAVLACTTALTLGLTALAGAISGHGAAFGGLVGVLRTDVITTLLQVTMGAAFGALIPITAVAVGAFFLAPTVWTAASHSLFGHSARWLDIFSAYNRLGSKLPSRHLAETITAAAVWVVIPAAVGLYRAAHREAK